MAEKGTESGTAGHKKKAREKGDSVRSRELLSAVAMMAGVVTVGVVAKTFVGSWRIVFEQSLTAAAVRDNIGEMQWAVAIRRTLNPAVLPLAFIMAASFVGALVVGIAQGGGFEFHPNAIGLKFSKLNPVSNLATGQVWTGQQSLSLGLIDKIGGFRVALIDTARTAGIKGEPTIVRPASNKKGLAALLNGDADDLFPSASKLLDRSPGFYFMWK